MILLRTISIAALLCLAAPFVWEKATGDYFMTVTGVSMEPTYHVGDVLLVKKPSGGELQDMGLPVIVTFGGDPSTQYVHRVKEVTPEGTVLQGDNNELPDPVLVTEAELQGTPRLALQGAAATVYDLSQNWPVRLSVGVLLAVSLFLPLRPRAPRAPRARTPRPASTPTATSAEISELLQETTTP
ncbi:S24/S26 family peptidase [Plantibacter sp. YIM 135249]|uniref:S24/S26 family peptidase n=1 Tax=Plantibacter sp. YIM 135249 TaxID=3423918 RepID=UPI003D34B2BE